MDIKQILMTFNSLGNNNLAMTGTTGISEKVVKESPGPWHPKMDKENLKSTCGCRKAKQHRDCAYCGIGVSGKICGVCKAAGIDGPTIPGTGRRRCPAHAKKTGTTGISEDNNGSFSLDESCGKLDHEFEEDEVTGQKKCVKCGEEFLDELEVDEDEKLKEGMFSNIFSKKQNQFEELLSKKGFDDNGLKNIGDYKINVLADDKKQNFIVRVSINNRPLKKFYADNIQDLDEIIGGAFSFVNRHQEELIDDDGVQTMQHGPTKSERKVLNLESKNKSEDENMSYKDVNESIRNFSKNLMEKLSDNECEKCSGDGCVPCQACKGHEGNKKCKECKGEGEITCGSCNGSGFKKAKKKIKESGEIVGNAQGLTSSPVIDSFNVSVSQSNYNGELTKNITVSASGNKADEIADILKLSGILTDSQPVSAELPIEIDYDEIEPDFDSSTPTCDLCAQSCSDDCACDCHHDVREDEEFNDYDKEDTLQYETPYDLSDLKDDNEDEVDESFDFDDDDIVNAEEYDHKEGWGNRGAGPATNMCPNCEGEGCDECGHAGSIYEAEKTKGERGSADKKKWWWSKKDKKVANMFRVQNLAKDDKEKVDEGSHPDIPGSDDYCDACGEEVANQECGHGMLCDNCERDIHGEGGCCDGDDGFVRESKNITTKKNVKEAWANEPNEKIAHWRAVIDDADGPNNPKDMYPNRLGDNPLKVAKNKKNKEIHEMSEKLSQKFKSFTLSEGKKKLTAKDKNKGIDDCGKKKVTESDFDNDRLVKNVWGDRSGLGSIWDKIKFKFDKWMIGDHEDNSPFYSKIGVIKDLKKTGLSDEQISKLRDLANQSMYLSLKHFGIDPDNDNVVGKINSNFIVYGIVNGFGGGEPARKRAEIYNFAKKLLKRKLENGKLDESKSNPRKK